MSEFGRNTTRIHFVDGPVDGMSTNKEGEPLGVIFVAAMCTSSSHLRELPQQQLEWFMPKHKYRLGPRAPKTKTYIYFYEGLEN